MPSLLVLLPTPFRETVFLAFGVDTAARLSLQDRIEPRHTNSVRTDARCRCFKTHWELQDARRSQKEKDRQCASDVTLRRVRATIAAVGKQ